MNLYFALTARHNAPRASQHAHGFDSTGEHNPVTKKGKHLMNPVQQSPQNAYAHTLSLNQGFHLSSLTDLFHNLALLGRVQETCHLPNFRAVLNVEKPEGALGYLESAIDPVLIDLCNVQAVLAQLADVWFKLKPTHQGILSERQVKDALTAYSTLSAGLILELVSLRETLIFAQQRLAEENATPSHSDTQSV